VQPVLYYVHDPMCSWCWAFEGARSELFRQLPSEFPVRRLLGGLAADTDEPMPEAMVNHVKANWRAIEARVPGVRFNDDFWTSCRPRRSTWPACRAVIAAREQGAKYDEIMTRAIQQAYYRQARNPSENATLTELAADIGLDSQRFSQILAAPSTQETLLGEIHTTRQLNMRSFPGLTLQTASGLHPVPVDYGAAAPMVEKILKHLETERQS